MENAGAASEASVRRPQKKARVSEPSDGGPSKSTGSNPEKNDRIPADGEQLSGDEGDGDWLFDGAENRSPKARRKRGPSAKVAGAMEDWKLIGLPMIYLKDIVPAATNTINTQFILLEKGNFSQDGKEITCLALVADETASLHFQLWGDECHSFEPGDIIRLTNGIFSYHRSHLVLRAGRKGKAEKVGEFNMLFVETPNMSEIKWAKDPSNPRKFVQEAVVSPHSRIFPPLP